LDMDVSLSVKLDSQGKRKTGENPSVEN